MATWKLRNDDGRVTLLYYVRGQPVPQHLGTGDSCLSRDVLAFAIDGAVVADLILVEDAVFARLPTPAPVLGRVLAS